MKVIEWKPVITEATYSAEFEPQNVWLEPGIFRLLYSDSDGHAALAQVEVKPGELLPLSELLGRDRGQR